jgi:hypothetical protein
MTVLIGIQGVVIVLLRVDVKRDTLALPPEVVEHSMSNNKATNGSASNNASAQWVDMRRVIRWLRLRSHCE